MLKRCKDCGRRKRTDLFYPLPRMRDGLASSCKSCTRERVRKNYQRNREHYRRYERERFTRPERKAKVMAYQAARRTRFPGKYKARQKILNAVRDGRVVRPSECQHCHTAGKVQAHHHDYRKPFDVQWLCFKCHREIGHGQVVIAA